MRNTKRFFIWSIEIIKWVAGEYWWLILPIFLWALNIVIILALKLPVDGFANKALFFLTQITGIFYILRSIDNTLKLFEKSLFKDIFRDPIKRFPKFRRRHLNLTADNLTMSPPRLSSPSVSMVKRPEAVEEEIEYLKREIKNLNGKVDENFKNLRSDFRRETKKVRARVGVVDRDVKNLESKTTEIHTDQREQIFGVLLSIHAPIVELLSFLF
jgi:hypothetical protein